MKMLSLKIELEGIEPPIWRRIKIASSQNLWSLHNVIQVAMGWTGSHMHEFIIKKVRYGQTDEEMDEVNEFYGVEIKDCPSSRQIPCNRSLASSHVRNICQVTARATVSVLGKSLTSSSIASWFMMPLLVRRESVKVTVT
ncbi:MAG: plasmid pRiA4b ORF-3 family protein [Acidithiobacillus sp.]